MISDEVKKNKHLFSVQVGQVAKMTVNCFRISKIALNFFCYLIYRSENNILKSPEKIDIKPYVMSLYFSKSNKRFFFNFLDLVFFKPELLK